MYPFNASGLMFRPRRVLCLFLATILAYVLVASWYRAEELSSMLQQARNDGIADLLHFDDMNPFGFSTTPSPDADNVVADYDAYDDDVYPEMDRGVKSQNVLNEGSYATDSAGNSGDDFVRQEFDKMFAEARKRPGAQNIYGQTLATLVKDSKRSDDASLTEWNTTTSFTTAKPFTFHPYPDYNSRNWKASGRAKHVPCMGPLGRPVKDVSAFVGRPKDFPKPSFGSYEALGLDPNVCFERDTRLGLYALTPEERDKARWGALQRECAELNKDRFDQTGPANHLARDVYGILSDEDRRETDNTKAPSHAHAHTQARRWAAPTRGEADKTLWRRMWEQPSKKTGSESRTAVLLRSYTGKTYTENDRYNIRALVSELSLQTGGEYQVFLLVHVKDGGVNLWDNETYEHTLDTVVPQEFRDMTLLWNDDMVQSMYPLLDRNHVATVHNAQWLSVQKFMQEFRDFSFVWNWEMDMRVIGHMYDMLSRMGEFAKKQPRRELWERNERYYIPDFYGDYDTAFRGNVSARTGNESVWGAPKLPMIRPIGPTPRKALPMQDQYRWGVGEEADLITLSPLFDPKETAWVFKDMVWAYDDEEHPSASLPRRGTIVTQSRLSRRLLDIMHTENLRGNHVASEMTPGTVALLHGLKAVAAPMPIFMDRPLTPQERARWYNGGPRGSSGGAGSAMGWNLEGRFEGMTWYYRAGPPQRLYNNWVGYEDKGTGGLEWELQHGRPCLPAMFLHPVKDIVPTGPGYQSESRLPYS